MHSILVISAISIIGPILGSLLGVYKKCSERLLYTFLGFAAGIMLAISFLELIPESITLSSGWICLVGFFVGLVIIYLIDVSIPHIHHSMVLPENEKNPLERTATFILIGIFIHNFPEGLAIGIGSLSSFNLSLAIALGITIHDIPEALCTSLPYFAATGKRLKSFLVSASTIIPTLLGIFIAYFFLGGVSGSLIGFLMAATAGVMIYISADELIPASFKNIGHKSVVAMLGGILVVFLLTFL